MMDEKKESLMNQGMIVSDQIAPSFVAIENSQSYRYTETVIKGLSLRLNTRVLVANREGNVILDSYDDYIGRNISGVQEIQNALSGISSAQSYNFSDIGKTVYVSVPIYNAGNIIGAILMSSSPEDIFRRIDEISSSFMRLFLGVVVIIGVVSLIFSGIVATPIVNLTQVVNEVTLNNRNQKALYHSHDELGELALAFNEMIDKLYKVDDMRKQFVSNVSHELRTPIASMKIIAETLMHSKPTTIEIYDDFMIDINNELDRLNKIIETLLNLVNLEKEGLELEYAQTILNHLVQKTVDIMMPLAQKKNITLSIKPYQNVFCALDAHKMRQCLINIIGNAINYTPEGGSIIVTLEDFKGEISIRVSDTGIGIPENEIGRVFERFYRVDSARARDTGGSGLGLSIAFQIVSLHGGKIDVQSEVGVGTTFTIVLPKLEVA